MANFRVWVEKSPRNGNLSVKYRDGRTKLPNGRWKVFTKVTIDKTERLCIDGKWKAAQWIAESMARKLEERYIKNELGHVDSNERLDPLIDKFITDCERNNLQWTTIEQYEGILKRLGSQYHFVMLSDLNSDRVNSFKDTVSSVMELSTVRRNIMVLFTFTNWLIENKMLKEWPFSKKLLPTLKQRTPKYYTLQEWEALDKALETISHQARLACNLAYYAGLRKIELVGDGRERKGVLWEDLSWHPDGSVVLMVRKEVAKGEKTARSIELAPEIVALLGSRKSGPLITLTRNQFTYIVLGKARKKSGIKEDLTIHGQRHSFAQGYLQDGDMDLGALQEALGHSDIQTTQVYSAHEKSHLAKGIRTAYERRQIRKSILAVAGQKYDIPNEIAELKRTQMDKDGLASSNGSI